MNPTPVTFSFRCTDGTDEEPTTYSEKFVEEFVRYAFWKGFLSGLALCWVLYGLFAIIPKLFA
jgi:hypothetical protein